MILIPKYITVSQFRATDTGIVGTASNAGITDLALGRFIAQAESDIDAHFGFAPYLQGGFEAHMSGLIQAGFDQYTRRLALPSFPVPVRNAQRYRIHISNASPSGVGLFASINTTDVVLNQAGGYVEIVPLQAITYSLAPIVWDLGLEPPIIEADFELGFFLPLFGAPLYNDVGDFKAYRALDSAWTGVYTQATANQPNQLPPIPAVIYKNGAPLAGTTLTTALVSGVAVTSLTVSAIPASIPGSTALTITTPGGVQMSVTTSGSTAVGATSISISSFTPTAPVPAGSYVANGFSVSYPEGLVTFASANIASDVITADFTYTIPEWVRDATIAQTTWLIAMRAVAQLGALPYDLVKNGEQEVRRKKLKGQSALCDEALSKVQEYVNIGIA